MKRTCQPIRRRILIRGLVQGVGFRPFVHRLANELDLRGWVKNTPLGVTIEVEGPAETLERFDARLEPERPSLSTFYSVERSTLAAAGYDDFTIHDSDGDGSIAVPVLPDIATCPECLREILDPSDRRYRYPFTNCTHCGPRFSIVRALPYDRANTTMRGFVMCDRCRAEYEDPRDRRYHAQPNACPECGPQLALWDAGGAARARGDDAIAQAVRCIRRGDVVAVKGLGGFHLLVDANNAEAVERLRRRKHRDEKPLALMAPSLDWVRANCRVSDTEERLLRGPAAPIVLLRRAGDAAVADGVSPRNPFLGVMLPYTPLHHLLLADLGIPVVATSGNISEEPICTDEHAALATLSGIADVFLVHDRPIARHVDDSVARVVAGGELLIRRARGYAPTPIGLGAAAGGDGATILAVGAHQKNVVGLCVDGAVVLGQHIGDLSTSAAYEAMQRSAADLQRLYDTRAVVAARDAHPDYLSTRYAASLGIREVAVQHHVAHVIACAVENDLEGPILGVSWDGTGYGDDGTVWGGEFIEVDTADPASYRRAGHLRTFRLPGGERAVREPRRSAVGALYESLGDDAFERPSEALSAFSENEARAMAALLRGGFNSPVTSSAGRLFDAAASLVGLRQTTSFEGQAAMELEFEAHRSRAARRVLPYRLRRDGTGVWVVDWAGVLDALVALRAGGVSVPDAAAAFHDTLADVVAAVATGLGATRVALTGGCFQNVRLLESALARLEEAGVRAVRHQRVPPNDGGIALGQAAYAAALERETR